MRHSILHAASLAASLTLSPAAAAQTAISPLAAEIKLGVTAQRVPDPVTARTHLERAVALDSMSYEAQWRLAEVLMDIGKQTPDSVKSPERDSIYTLAETHARRAVALAPDLPDGHYTLSASIGLASLTKTKKERVRRAGEIRDEGLKALALNPEHHMTLHVMGRWNAEIMRLSGLERFFAKNFLGGKIFSAAKWDSAVVYMQKAVATSPDNIYHRLDLGKIFVDLGRYEEARQEFRRIADLPLYDVMDPQYKRNAVADLERIKGKKDRES